MTPPLGGPGIAPFRGEALISPAAAAALVLCLLYSPWEGAEGGTPHGHSQK